MKLSYNDFVTTLYNKLKCDNGKAQITLLSGKTMDIFLSENKDGIMNSRYPLLNCKFEILYAILEKANSLGGIMYRGDAAAHNGAKIGSKELSVNSIDGYISIKYYNGKIGDTTTRRSTYYSSILSWSGFVTIHKSQGKGSYITVNKEYQNDN